MLRTYDDFVRKYSAVIKETVSLLRDKQLATFVVGDVRSRSGVLQPIGNDTNEAFKRAGCALYNNNVLLTALGTAPQRAERTMSAASKLVPVHQQVITYVKGSGFGTAEAGAAGICANEDRLHDQP